MLINNTHCIILYTQNRIPPCRHIDPFRDEEFAINLFDDIIQREAGELLFIYNFYFYYSIIISVLITNSCYVRQECGCCTDGAFVVVVTMFHYLISSFCKSLKFQTETLLDDKSSFLWQEAEDRILRDKLRLWTATAAVSDCGTHVAWPFYELFQKPIAVSENWTKTFEGHQKKPKRGDDESNRPSKDDKKNKPYNEIFV